jgi:hypothetical protein
MDLYSGIPPSICSVVFESILHWDLLLAEMKDSREQRSEVMCSVQKKGRSSQTNPCGRGEQVKPGRKEERKETGEEGAVMCC